MLGLCPKVGVGDAQAMVSAQLEQSLSILVHFTHAELSNAGGPRVVICTHSGIEVAQANKLFIVRDAADDGCEVLVELVFCIRCCGHCRGIHADKGDWSCSGVESLSRSEPLLPGSIMLSRLFLTAKPTPYSLCSPEPFPCQ